MVAIGVRQGIVAHLQGKARLRDAGALPLDGRMIVTDLKDLIYLSRQEQRAREQAADSNSITARIAHLARAKEYALEIVTIREKQVANG